MKARPSNVIAACILLGATYFAAYFASVSTSHVTIKASVIAVPVYHPFDTAAVRAIFAPAHLIDAAFIRPARWESQTI